MHCRFCNNSVELIHDFGCHPFPNHLLSHPDEKSLNVPVLFYSCPVCGLGQLDYHANPFVDSYPFKSSANAHLNSQYRAFLQRIKILLPQNPWSLDIGANDGTLVDLMNFEGMTAEGVDPTSSRVDIYKAFFGSDWAIKNDAKYDLITANNVIGHVPDLIDFMMGLQFAISDEGIISIEMPDLDGMIRQPLGFDAIYPEHLSYFNPSTMVRIFKKFGFKLIGLEKMNFFGAGQRYLFTPNTNKNHYEWGIPQLMPNYSGFSTRIYQELEWDFGRIKLELKKGKKIACFGAAARGISRINYSGLNHKHILFCFDDTPEKWNKYMPGSKIPILNPALLRNMDIDLLWILPWNHKEAILKKLHNYNGAII